MSTGEEAVFCSQAFPCHWYLKQHSLALQRQRAEQSIMHTLCLTKPIKQIPNEEDSSLKKRILLTQPQDTADMQTKLKKSVLQNCKDALAGYLSQIFCFVLFSSSNLHFSECYMRNLSSIVFDSFRAQCPTGLNDGTLPLELIIQFVMALIVFSNVFLTRALFFPLQIHCMNNKQSFSLIIVLRCFMPP